MNDFFYIKIYASTDVGQVRKNNEDNFLATCLNNKDFWNATQPFDQVKEIKTDKELLLAVADGLGGALAGEVASQLTVDLVREQLVYIQEHRDFNHYPFYEQLRLSVELANKGILFESNKNVQLTGMGSTFTGLAFSNNSACVAQVGDSRCYLVRDNRIKQISKDQSLVGQLVESGFITEEEAENHNLRNVILQALGGQPFVNVVVDTLTMKEKDIFLLCSDGLTTHVKNHEILKIVNEGSSLKETVDTLIKLANERGGQDNITIVIAQVIELEAFEPKNEIVGVNLKQIPRDVKLPKDLDLFDPITLENKILEEPIKKHNLQNKIDEVEEGTNITSLAIPKITLPIENTDSALNGFGENHQPETKFQPKVELAINTNLKVEEKKRFLTQSFYEKIWQYLVKIFYPTPELR